MTMPLRPDHPPHGHAQPLAAFDGPTPMPQGAARGPSHGHDHPHGHDHGASAQGRGADAEAPARAHVRHRPPPSLVRMSLVGRLAIAGGLSAAVWCAVVWAMTPIAG